MSPKLKTIAIYIAFAISGAALLTGCANNSQAIESPSVTVTQSPTPTHVAAGVLPTSCQVKAILSQDKTLQAWDKTDPAKQGTELDCLIGVPNSDVAWYFSYAKETPAEWEKEFQSASSGSSDWITDTVTAANLSTIYKNTPESPDNMGDSFEVRVYDHGIVLDYSDFGSYTRDNQLMIQMLNQITVQ